MPTLKGFFSAMSTLTPCALPSRLQAEEHVPAPLLLFKIEQASQIYVLVCLPHVWMVIQ